MPSKCLAGFGHKWKGWATACVFVVLVTRLWTKDDVTVTDDTSNGAT